MKKLVTILLICSQFVAFSQGNTMFGDTREEFKSDIADLKKTVQNQTESLSRYQKDVRFLQNKVNTLETQVDSLSQRLSQQDAALINQKESLVGQITSTKNETSNQITEVKSTMDENSKWWLASIIGAALLSILLYFLQKNKANSNENALFEKLSQTQKSLEEETLRIDNKLVEVMEGQLKVQNSLNEQTTQLTTTTPKEEDHSLAIKVANEVTRMQMNLAHMDPKTKGYKQLNRAVNAVIDNFNASGYDIPELLNKPFSINMHAIATMEPDDSLEKGVEIIRRVIKPQINYKGKMIQAASIAVAYGE